MSEKEFNNQNTPNENELMVTITLDEYRDLVKDSARMSHYLGESLRLEKELKRLEEKHRALCGKYEGMYADYRRLLDRESERENAIKQVQNNV